MNTAFQIGEQVTWLHQPSGGYGYVIPVNAKIVAFGKGQIQIDAELKNGGTKRTFVREFNLRKRVDGK